MIDQQKPQAPISPQLAYLLQQYFIEGREITSIRMAPMDVVRLLREMGAEPDLISPGLEWTLARGYHMATAYGSTVQIMPDLTVSPGRMELADAQSVPIYGLQCNN